MRKNLLNGSILKFSYAPHPFIKDIVKKTKETHGPLTQDSHKLLINTIFLLVNTILDITSLHPIPQQLRTLTD